MKFCFNIDKIFLINLEDRKDRLEYADKQLKREGINYTLFYGIPGKKLNLFYTGRHHGWYITRDQHNNIIEENMIANCRTPYKKSRMAGMVGCFLSHYLIIRDAYYNNYECIMVFEDDITLEKGFIKKLNKFYKKIPKDRDMLLIGWNPFFNNGGEEVNEYFLKSNAVWGTHGYMVNKSGISKIYKYLNLVGMVDHIDLMMYAHMQDLNLYGLKEKLVHQGGFSSDIW